MVAKKILVSRQIPLGHERIALAADYSTNESDQILFGLRCVSVDIPDESILFAILVPVRVSSAILDTKLAKPLLSLRVSNLQSTASRGSIDIYWVRLWLFFLRRGFMSGAEGVN